MLSLFLDLPQGTLDLLVLKALTWGPRHGYAIARILEERTGDRLRIEEGSLYPALYRMEGKGWIRREYTPSDRRIKRLDLSPAGQEVLQHVEPGIRRVQHRLLAPLTAAEAKTLVRLMAKMADGDEDDGADG